MLRKIFDLHYKMLEKYPSLRPFKPLIDAGDNFFYGTPHTTKEKPYIREGVDIKRFMIMVLFAVLPAAIASVYFYGQRAILVILASYIIGGLTEVIFCIVRKEEITEGFLITGILYPLILPPTIPLWMLSVGIIFGVIFGKEVFGGTGKNPFNAALVARCFLYISFPLYMTGGAFVEPYPNSIAIENNKPVFQGLGGFTSHRGLFSHEIKNGKFDAMCEATPLAKMKELRLKVAEQGSTPEDYQKYMNYVKTSLPNLFWGYRSGSMGETCAVLLILGGIMLIAMKVANWRTILSTILGGAVCSFFFYDANCLSDKLYLMAFTLLSGGFLFGAIFMTTDPVTGPITQTGRYFYGFAIGCIALLIRRFSGYAEGIMFSILLMNIFAALIDEIVIMVRYRGVKK
ncbi:MAG: RnfABCDGE type electron transport complex subunit D [Candidatus Brocadiae bacterium]|nr:RnfABCDGE type electron transport complex subunit D [Candidatus Brocadiia bacterium]